MANVLVENQSLQDIADAIREKNGGETLYKPSEMAAAIEAIPSGGDTPTGTKTITANGTGIDVASYAYADVAVPNSYSSGDEGKVVSNGALVSQTSDTVTQNGTVDTTLINSLAVNVSGGGSSIASGSFTQSGNSLTKEIDTGNSSITHFLIFATASPYGKSVRCGGCLYVDFTLGLQYAVTSGSNGSTGAGGYKYDSISGASKSGSVVTISSGGSYTYQFNNFVDGITYQWYAW